MTFDVGFSRSLGMTVSTTNCIGLRKEPYKLTLQLVFDYLIEYDGDGGEMDPDLIGIENAVAYGVAAALDDCDKEESPLYAVELASRHKVFQDGYCAPVVAANECQVIRGYTEIRMDRNSAAVELAAYSAIESVLHEPLFLDQFVSMSYARVDFVRAVDQVLQSNEPDETDHSASLVAIAAAILSFALAVIFLAGLWRKIRRNKARVKKMQVETPGGKKRFLLGSAPRKYYELDEEVGGSGSGFKMVEIMEPMENPSVTWSISDITSESGSILSNLSRTTSKLERIEEEDNESQTDDEWDGNDTYEDDNDLRTDSIPLEYLYDTSGSPRHHVDQWDVDALEEGTEPEGCRYLEDSSDDEEDEEEEEEGTNMNYEEELTAGGDYDTAGFDRSIDTVMSDDEDDDDNAGEYDDPSCPSLSSILNSSEDTVETSNETRPVLHDSSQTPVEDQIEKEKVQKWLIELVKELRKAKRRKLLTYP